MDKDKVLALCDSIINIAEEEPTERNKVIVYYENSMAAIKDYTDAIRSEVSASPSDEVVNLLKKASEFLSKELLDIGGCDHESGICGCHYRHLRDDIEEFLKRLDASPVLTYSECPVCHNRGYVAKPEEDDSGYGINFDRMKENRAKNSELLKKVMKPEKEE